MTYVLPNYLHVKQWMADNNSWFLKWRSMSLVMHGIKLQQAHQSQDCQCIHAINSKSTTAKKVFNRRRKLIWRNCRLPLRKQMIKMLTCSAVLYGNAKKISFNQATECAIQHTVSQSQTWVNCEGCVRKGKILGWEVGLSRLVYVAASSHTVRGKWWTVPATNRGPLQIHNQQLVLVLA